MGVHRGIQVLRLVVILLSLQVPCSWAAGDNGSDKAVEVTLDFQNVELADMISTISELTGKNFVYDEGVRGKVSILSPRPVTIDEAYRLFTTVLNVKGFTIIPSGKVSKIVPIRSAKEANLPIGDGQGLGEQFITRIIELKKLDARVVADTILRPLMPKTSHVVAHSPTNTLVLTDSAANIDRLSRILDSLDRTWDGEQMEIVQLYYSDAEETAGVVMQILQGGGTSAPTARGKAAATSLQKKALGQVIPYARTNKLMLIGDRTFISNTRKIVAQLDEKADLTRAGVHVYYLENAEAEGLSETLNKILSETAKVPANKQSGSGKKLFSTVTITADKPTNALIVNATAEDYDGIKELIGQLDIKRKQVFVEALILELGMGALLDVGVSLQGGADVNNDSVVFGTSNLNSGQVGLKDLSPGEGSTIPSLLTKAISGILLGGMFNPITTTGPDGSIITIPALSALIDLAETDQNVNVLSAPRLLTSDNEEAEIIVGSNVPIITSKASDNAGNPINSIERQDVALTLRFTPQITEGNMVRLTVFQETSDIAPANEDVGNVDAVGPTINKRLLRSTVVAEDGKTVVLGGLFKTFKQEVVTKVPLLGDIPLLGYLFRSKREEERKTSLLIFITPHVIRDSADLDRITRDNHNALGLFRDEEGAKAFIKASSELLNESSADSTQVGGDK